MGGDTGSGALIPNGVSCIGTNNQRISFVDLTGGATRPEGPFETLRNAVATAQFFADTASTATVDNAAGLSWPFTVDTAEPE